MLRREVGIYNLQPIGERSVEQTINDKLAIRLSVESS